MEALFHQSLHQDDGDANDSLLLALVSCLIEQLDGCWILSEYVGLDWAWILCIHICRWIL